MLIFVGALVTVAIGARAASAGARDDTGEYHVSRCISRIVLKLDGVDDVSALYEHCRSRTADIEPLQFRPWGLHDFRLFDPDGYYVRVTHASPDAAEPSPA